MEVMRSGVVQHNTTSTSTLCSRGAHSTTQHNVMHYITSTTMLVLVYTTTLRVVVHRIY